MSGLGAVSVDQQNEQQIQKFLEAEAKRKVTERLAKQAEQKTKGWSERFQDLKNYLVGVGKAVVPNVVQNATSTVATAVAQPFRTYKPRVGYEYQCHSKDDLVS
jgi:hypothetical protein